MIRLVVLALMLGLSLPSQSATTAKEFISCVVKNQVDSLKASYAENSAALKQIESYQHPVIEAGVSENKDVTRPSNPRTTDLFLSYNQTLYAQDKSQRESAYRMRLNAQTQEIKSQLAELVKAVIENYFELTNIRYQIEVAKERLSESTKVVGYLEGVTNAKMTDGTELVIAQSENLRSQTDIGKLKLDEISLLQKIQSVTGGMVYDFADLLKGAHPSETDRQYWRSRDDQIPTVLKENLMARSYREEAKSYKMPWIPKVDIGMQMDAYRENGKETDPPGRAQGMVKLSWPLWDGNERQVQSGRTAALANVYEERQRLAKLQFSTEVEANLRSIQEIEALRGLLKRRIALTEKSLQLSWTKFRLNKMSYLQYHDVEKNLFDAKSDLKSLEIRLAAFRIVLNLWDQFSSPDFFSTFSVTSVDCAKAVVP